MSLDGAIVAFGTRIEEAFLTVMEDLRWAHA